MANHTESIMATFKFYIPAINLMGAGCLQEAAADIQGYGFRKALIVTDKILNQTGVVAKVTGLLAEHGIESVVFDETKPNPTMANVEAGLAMLRPRLRLRHLAGRRLAPRLRQGHRPGGRQWGSIKDYEGWIAPPSRSCRSSPSIPPPAPPPR
jgi:alcohol dehydrogenase